MWHPRPECLECLQDPSHLPYPRRPAGHPTPAPLPTFRPPGVSCLPSGSSGCPMPPRGILQELLFRVARKGHMFPPFYVLGNSRSSSRFSALAIILEGSATIADCDKLHVANCSMARSYTDIDPSPTSRLLLEIIQPICRTQSFDLLSQEQAAAT